MPTFSIIIPAHNEEKYIAKTLHSIKNQTYQNFEVIVVANGCTDKTEEIAHKRNVRVLSLPNPNVSVARNAGALNAQGEILVFLDADTSLEERCLYTIKKEFLGGVATTKVKPDVAKFKAVMGLKNMLNKGKILKGFGGVLICNKEDFQAVKGYNPDITVREHRHLRKRLEERGSYGFINATVTTSMRRFGEWGLVKTGAFWVKQLFVDTFGDLKKSDYEKIR